jgi:uncharacterized lipoprotein YddW (UPF0748 family)
LRKKLHKLLLWFFLVLITACQDSHSQSLRQEREVRAVWVATFFQLDFPRESSRSRVVLTEQWRQMIRQLRNMGINTLYFQVRPSGDAFYKSELVPWSRFLSGQEGQGPEGDFDPLSVFIEMAHEAGMELHAWMNPLRVSANLDTSLMAANHIVKQHPDWTFAYGNRYYLDPGLPGVRWHILNVVEELVTKYDVDGIHMDDYFYPYPSGGVAVPDSLTYSLYGQSYFDREDWRRSNVDRLIEEMAALIKQKKAHVKFGISPFGVWRNQVVDPSGSATSNKITSYDHLYADVVKWLDEGWIDYVVPQLYWEMDHPISDYETLLEWWAGKVQGNQLIIGHAAHKVGNGTGQAWQHPEELPRQMTLTFDYPEVRGHAFFRARSLLGNPLGIADSLRRDFARAVVLPEVATRIRRSSAQAVLKKPRLNKEGVRLCWNEGKADDHPYYYGVYRFDGKKKEWNKGQEVLLYTTPYGMEKRRFCFSDKHIRKGSTYTYWIVSFDRFHRKVGVSKPWVVEMGEKKVKVRQ